MKTGDQEFVEYVKSLVALILVADDRHEVELLAQELLEQVESADIVIIPDEHQA